MNTPLAIPKSPSLVARILPPAIGLAVMATAGPVIANAVHAAAVVLFEFGHVWSVATEIFCN